VLNEEGIPRLRVNALYRSLLHRSGDEAKPYVEQKLRSAVWLIKSVEQRQRTLRKVTQSPVKCRCCRISCLSFSIGEIMAHSLPLRPARVGPARPIIEKRGTEREPIGKDKMTEARVCHTPRRAQRHLTRVAVTSFEKVYCPCCLTFANVPSTVAPPDLHGGLANENTRTASVPSLKSNVS
jgi:hypothetical protein